MQNAPCRRILGIDPGLASTGWGILDTQSGKIKYIDHGTIITRGQSNDRQYDKFPIVQEPKVLTKADGTNRAERLFFIMEAVRKIIEKYKPVEAAIENLFFGKNVSSAIPVAEARGVISAVLAEKSVIVHEFTPNAIKKGVTGIAGADKAQVQEMVRIILGLDKVPKPDHAADALAAAICAANSNIVH